jgi:molecular chaperone HtpG
MTMETKERISFDVETSRILQILSAEIYDSPKAFLRENVQNAYDAILMRCTAESASPAQRKITITVEPNRLIVRDDGIGMTEEVLKNNFWKAGSSGKRSDLAQRAGVIGTFGIGAMANFGVCTALRVETRNIDSKTTLISSAKREDLRIAHDCIDLERVQDDREPGTIVVADLDSSSQIGEEAVRQYLTPYVQFLHVPVLVNGQNISQKQFEDSIEGKARGFTPRPARDISRGAFAGKLETLINPQGRVIARLRNLSLNGSNLSGEVFFLQDGGQTQGYRNLFGLAPIPITGNYAFGGFVNLNILHPTAGREALSRESIEHVANIVALIEAEVSNELAETAAADQNQNFQQYISAHGLITHATRVTVGVLPSGEDVELGNLSAFEPGKSKLFYAGRDPTILKKFGTEQTNLVQISQNNPRRSLQLRYVREILKIEEVPEKTLVERIPHNKVGFEEAMFLVRLRGVLLDEYLMSDVDAAFAQISHGVAFHIEKKPSGSLELSISRDMPAVKMVVECYRTAKDVFDGFVKDFAREHLYPQIRDHVPSSTRQGRDALYKRLKENKELFRYEESEFGKAESLLADYLSGKVDLDQVLRSSAGRTSTQRQEVRVEQVGSVETEIPGIIDTAAAAPILSQLEAAPPILRPELSTDKKVLTVAEPFAKLNDFQLFLALSDRATRIEGEFLRYPHTTKLIWGSHRVVYIFTDAAGELSLYYDIELKEPLESATTGGAMFPTTTIITKDRTYVPVPKELDAAFRITEGAKEFYVRFDTIP